MRVHAGGVFKREMWTFGEGESVRIFDGITQILKLKLRPNKGALLARRRIHEACNQRHAQRAHEEFAEVFFSKALFPKKKVVQSQFVCAAACADVFEPVWYANAHA